MKNTLRHILLYLIVVILPTGIGSTLFIQKILNDDLSKRVEEAKWVASIHETHWNQFVSETVTSLEMLSLVVETLINTPEQMKPLLQRSHQTDPRYGGLYLLDNNGYVMSGSNQFLPYKTLYMEKYIQDVIQTKDIIISSNQEVLKDGQKVIGIANPVLDNQKNLQFITVALLRVDYVQNIMNVLTPDTEILIMNANNDPVLSLNMEENANITSDEQWISKPVSRLPWVINVKIGNRDPSDIITKSILIIFSIFILTQILFLLIKYVLLKRQALIEKKQNEVQKLELVGTLAASTAHEIRNPLTGIKGLVQLLSEKYKNPDDQFYFSVINEEIKRINQIVSEFLILGKPTAQKTEVIDLRTIIQEVHPLISSEANLYNVHLTNTLPTLPVYVNCAKDQIKQVILNITKNAFESMADGGILTIHLAAENQTCKLTITDTGTGIPSEALEKIFIPFYTSKDTGTGLGLVVCKRILNSFGGDIFITSKEHKGTTVTMELPITN